MLSFLSLIDVTVVKVGCSKLVIESSYNRLIAPPPLNSSKAIIRITITIHSILQVKIKGSLQKIKDPSSRLMR